MSTHPRAVERVEVGYRRSRLRSCRRTGCYMVTNGGIVTCMDATTGKVLFRTRLGAGGAYYASPVMAGEHLYLTSGDGVVTVIRDADQFTAVAMSDLAEPVFATPAIVDGHIYVRTATRLYAFRRAPPPSP